MRTLSELINVEDPAWDLVEGWVESAAHAVEVLHPSAGRDEVLLAAQVTLRSALGAVIHNTGGLLIDGGWLRVLGSGHPRLPRTVTGWNEQVKAAGCVLVADDAVGGFYAINQGGLGAEKGNVFFFSPDRLVWEDMGAGYSDFLRWALTGDLDGYYGRLRQWEWRGEVGALAGDQALALDPLPCTRDGQNVAAASRRAVPVGELFELYVRGLGPQLLTLRDGQRFTVRFSDEG